MSNLWCCPFTLMHVLLTRWWGLRLDHDAVWLWEDRPGSRKLCLKRKVVLLMLYYIDKNLFYQSLSRIIFKICFSRSCSPSWATKQTFWKLYSPADTFWLPKTVWPVLRLHHCQNNNNWCCSGIIIFNFRHIWHLFYLYCQLSTSNCQLRGSPFVPF